MTPKEKAQELLDKFRLNILDYEGSGLNTFKAKQCSLIAVEEVRFFHESLFYATEGSLFDDYLNKVKDEINKL